MSIKLICYELNEVPWRVIDHYISLKPNSALANVMKNSQTYTTHTKDSGELHPWTTWPTQHRGVYNDDHDIRFINQEILTDYPPIWEILSQHDISTGVFGSLQSWPTPKNNRYSFYVPDTFAQDARTLPNDFEAFQDFNLSQTQKDGGTAPKPIALNKDTIKTVLTLLKRGLKLKTLFKLGQHLLKEKQNPDHRTYRSIMQAPVAFDFYEKALLRYKPAFSTFFTNHVAGMMHRYWLQLFPEDFGSPDLSERDKFVAQNIIRAMDIADQQIGMLQKIADQHNASLLISSSMGQEAIERDEYLGEVRINNLQKLCSAIGYSGSISQNLAMQPDFAVTFESKEALKDFRKKVNALRGENGQELIVFKEFGNTLNVSLAASPECLRGKCLYVSGTLTPLEELGIEYIMRDKGTAYHQPKGIAIFYHRHLKANDSRQEIESIEIAPTILTHFKVARPPYMTSANRNILKALQVR